MSVFCHIRIGEALKVEEAYMLVVGDTENAKIWKRARGESGDDVSTVSVPG